MKLHISVYRKKGARVGRLFFYTVQQFLNSIELVIAKKTKIPDFI